MSHAFSKLFELELALVVKDFGIRDNDLPT
jgi:hypothetical protein